MDNIWTSGRDNTKIILGLDSPGFNSGQGKEFFFLLKSIQNISGAQRAYNLKNTGGSFLEMKRQSLEAKALTPPTDVKVKN